jgi:thymidine kinase
MDSGYLNLILGPMFSGKTSYLINIYGINRMTHRLLVINHASDNRYTSEAQMVSHDNKRIPCILVHQLSEIDIDMTTIDRILINEGQLFPDLYEFVMKQVYEHKKNVYVAGLDGDYKRNPIGQIHQLFSHADTIIKLQGTCSICKDKPSIFTLRTSKDTEQILIGTDQYKPVCRLCFEIHNTHV